MSREVPFEPEAMCDSCGQRGAFDFMGDWLCADCATAATGHAGLDRVTADLAAMTKSRDHYVSELAIAMAERDQARAEAARLRVLLEWVRHDAGCSAGIDEQKYRCRCGLSEARAALRDGGGGGEAAGEKKAATNG